MTDVARLAGVSHQTVSRVLNGSDLVRPDTKARVLDAVERLGYRRNMAARALASRRSGIIGVLSMETTLHGPASTLHGVERAARAAGYFVSVAVIDDGRPEATLAAIDRLVAQGVEGVVVIAPLARSSDPLRSLPDGLPVVVTQGDHTGRPTVTVDQTHGAELVTAHLLAQGAATVWHIAGPTQWVESEQRIDGWRQALAAAGARAPRPLRGDWSPRSGYRLGQRLAARDDVQAVFAANDHMALGLLRAFDEHHIRVPEDVLVAGFDDIPESEFFTPPLTTVHQDFVEVGRRAIDLLVQAIDRETPPPSAVVPARLVRRASSGVERRPARSTKRS